MSGTTPSATGTRGALGVPRRLVWLAPVLFLVALFAWGLASPAGSSPDDDFHVASIWCAGGERPGLCEDGEDAASREVPRALIRDPFCFVFKSEQSAACQGQRIQDLAADELVPVVRGNFEGLYPPVFYAAMSPLAGSDMDDSVVLMRWANATLYVLLLTAVVAAVPARLRRPAVLGAVATAVPLGMFVVPSTNPSSWAMLCAATLWVALLGLAESRGRRAWVLAGLSLVAVVLGAGARADAAVYAVFAVALVAVLTVGRVRPTPLRVVTPIVVTAVAGLLYTTAAQGDDMAAGLDDQVYTHLTTGQLLWRNLVEMPRFFVSMLGEWGLGWLDTPMTATTWVFSAAVFFSLVFWGLSSVGLRKALVFVGAFAALWLVPVITLMQSRAEVGQLVQPRYVLPLGVIVAGVALLPVEGRPLPRPGWAQQVAVVGSLSLANSLALHSTIRRFVTGNDVVGWNLDVAVEWWWGRGPSPMTLWAIGSLAFAGALVVLALVARDPRVTGEDAAEVPEVPTAAAADAQGAVDGPDGGSGRADGTGDRPEGWSQHLEAVPRSARRAGA